MIIRRAELTDVEIMQGIFRDTVEAVNSEEYTPEQRTAWAGRAEEVGPQTIIQGPCWVAEEEGIVGGYLALRAGHVDHIYVHPEWQGYGIGRALVETAEIHARGAARSRMTADAADGALGFFQAMGFSAGDREEVDTDGVLLGRTRVVREL